MITDNNNNNNDDEDDDDLSTNSRDDSGDRAVFVLLVTTMNPFRDTNIFQRCLYCVRTFAKMQGARSLRCRQTKEQI